jgi:tRNA uridine 5-carboxymethylaminomethyl modification enzyme
MLEIIADLQAACHPERSEAKPNAVERPAVLPGSSWGSAAGQPLAQLLKRPEITIEHLAPVLKESRPEIFSQEIPLCPPCSSVVKLSSEVRNELKSVETEIKYEGYLLQQQRAMDRLKKSEQHPSPTGSTIARSADSRARCRKN